MAEGTAALFTNFRTGEQLTPASAIGTASITNNQLEGPVGSLIGTASITNEQLAGPIIALIGTASVSNAQLAGPIVSLIGTASISNSQLATPSIVSVITSGVIAATNNLDIALGSHDMVEIDLIALEPGTDASSLEARFSQDNGSNYLSGASDYGWGIVINGTNISDAADSEIQINNAVGNAAGEMATQTLRIYRPAAASFAKTMTWYGGYIAATGQFVEALGWGKLIVNTDPITNVRFFWSTGGQFDTGYYAVRGYSFT